MRPTISLCLCLFVFSLVSLADEAPSKAARPNVVVIIADDLGWADIGYNNERVYSPHLDRLASEGVRFDQHYVMPQCTPTRVALMTGRYPSRFGGAALMASNEPSFPIGTPTLASTLQKAGYRTALSGKWHLGSGPEHGPNHFGFDSSYGSLAGAVGMYDHRYRSGPHEHTWHRDHQIIDGGENGVHATDLVTREAIRVIEESDGRPFFLYVPFHSVHTPLDERGPFVNRPTQRDPKNEQRWLDEDRIRWFNDPDGLIQQESDAEKRLLLAAVHHLDDAVGQIVAALHRRGTRENTLILFSSDNGPQGSWSGNAYPDDLKLTDFNQPLPFRGKKLDVWEGGIRVPAFANWPARLQAGTRSSPMHIIDWFPTLAAIAGVGDVPSGIDGINLRPHLLEGQSIPERDLYWTWHRKKNRWALRHQDWKIVSYGKKTPSTEADWQLFNLESHVREQDDRSVNDAAKRQELHQRFLAQQARDR